PVIAGTDYPIPTIAQLRRTRPPCTCISPFRTAEKPGGELGPGRAGDGGGKRDRITIQARRAPRFGSAEAGRAEADHLDRPRERGRVCDGDIVGRGRVPAALEPPLLDSLRPLAGRLGTD